MYQIDTSTSMRGNCVDRDWAPRIGLSAWEKPDFVTRVTHPDVVVNLAGTSHVPTYVHRSREFRTASLGDVNFAITCDRRWKSSWPVEHADRLIGCLENAITASNRYDGSIRAHIRTKLNGLLFTGGDVAPVAIYLLYIMMSASNITINGGRYRCICTYTHNGRSLYIIRQVDS